MTQNKGFILRIKSATRRDWLSSLSKSLASVSGAGLDVTRSAVRKEDRSEAKGRYMN